MNIYSNIIKQEAINLYRAGTPAAEIAISLSISRSTVYKWIKEQNIVPLDLTKSKLIRLENKIKQLEGIIEILQSVNCSVNSQLDEKLNALERLHGKYSVNLLCEALKVPRGTFYNFILRNKRDNTWYSKRQEELRIKIQEIYNENNQIFGAANITAVLKGQGYRTSEKTVRKLMRNMGLISIRQDAKSIYDNSVIESFFSSLKREELYRTKYRSEKELRTAIDNYMLFYNEKRPHTQNGYKTPLRKENEYRERQK